jgi:hypothetical protein
LLIRFIAVFWQKTRTGAPVSVAVPSNERRQRARALTLGLGRFLRSLSAFARISSGVKRSLAFFSGGGRFAILFSYSASASSSSSIASIAALSAALSASRAASSGNFRPMNSASSSSRFFVHAALLMAAAGTLAHYACPAGLFLEEACYTPPELQRPKAVRLRSR